MSEVVSWRGSGQDRTYGNTGGWWKHWRDGGASSLRKSTYPTMSVSEVQMVNGRQRQRRTRVLPSLRPWPFGNRLRFPVENDTWLRHMAAQRTRDESVHTSTTSSWSSSLDSCLSAPRFIEDIEEWTEGSRTL